MNASLLVVLGTVVVVASCSEGDETTTVGSAGVGGEGGQGVSSGGEGSGLDAGRGSVNSAGDSAEADDGGSAPGGHSGGGAPPWEVCAAEEYELPSYEGESSGLCAISEHMFGRCCDLSAFDLAASVEVRCARDGSACVAMSFCTAFSPENDRGFECGWHACESPENRGGAGGDDPQCPADKVEEAWEGVDALRPCANDGDCVDGLVCNQRYDNRMFCGEPDVGRLGRAGAG